MRDGLIHLNSNEDLKAKVPNWGMRGDPSRKPPLVPLVSLPLASPLCRQVDIMATRRQLSLEVPSDSPLQRPAALKFPTRHGGLMWNQTWFFPGVFSQTWRSPLIPSWFSHFFSRLSSVSQPNLRVLGARKGVETIDAFVRRNSWVLLNWMKVVRSLSQNDGFLFHTHPLRLHTRVEKRQD